MTRRFEPKIEILPQAQREIWPQLAPAPLHRFVLYGGTAVALHLGHRSSIDFDFFRLEPLDKNELERSFGFMRSAKAIQENPNTIMLTVEVPAGLVKVSFFGGLGIGRVGDPLLTSDSTLLVACLDDLMATKLKAILDRAEAKDYRDIAAMLAAGVSLERGLAAFGKMFSKDPALPLRALGYFKDGDLPTLSKHDQTLLRAARDRVTEIPDVHVISKALAL